MEPWSRSDPCGLLAGIGSPAERQFRFLEWDEDWG